MFNIFICGETDLKKELTVLLKNNCNVLHEPDETTQFIFDLDNYPAEKKAENINYIDTRCSLSIPVFTSSLCFSVSEQSVHSKYPERLIGFGAYSTFSNANLLEIAPSRITSENIISKAEDFLNLNNLIFARVPDAPGLVFPRVISMIINEAAQVFSEDIATRDDIDTAMKLGTNYPFGPLEWADKLGIDLVYNILFNLQRFFGEDRYRPHPILKEFTDLKLHGIKTSKGFYNY